MLVEFMRSHCLEVCAVTVPLLVVASWWGFRRPAAVLLSLPAYVTFLVHTWTRGLPVPIALWAFLVAAGGVQAYHLYRALRRQETKV